ncbi:MAG TPA: hypothetical protein VFZ00_12075 [Solirubrobacter sp.]|nr:hypothetical protein [Solirubrobacter sp.]
MFLAPIERNRAGLGDVLAVYTAAADWRLAQLVGQDDSYSASAARDARRHADTVLDRAVGIHRADPAVLADLCAAPTIPYAGFEHAVSELLEMGGATLGALSVLSAMLWARVRTVASTGGLHALRFPTTAEMEPRVGALGDEYWPAYAVKLERWNAARDKLTALRWPDDEFEALLASPEQLVAALRAARAPVRLTQLGVRDATARWALAHAHLMSERFTVADLAFFMGIWDEPDVDALLVSAARLGAGL